MVWNGKRWGRYVNSNVVLLFQKNIYEIMQVIILFILLKLKIMASLAESIPIVMMVLM